jgi:hypothetical protein
MSSLLNTALSSFNRTLSSLQGSGNPPSPFKSAGLVQQQGLQTGPKQDEVVLTSGASTKKQAVQNKRTRQLANQIAHAHKVDGQDVEQVKRYVQNIQRVIDKGADVNADLHQVNPEKFPIKGTTPLHVAAKQSTPEVIDFLLQKGADRTIRNVDKQTPRDIAKDEDNVEALNWDSERTLQRVFGLPKEF